MLRASTRSGSSCLNPSLGKGWCRGRRRTIPVGIGTPVTHCDAISYSIIYIVSSTALHAVDRPKQAHTLGHGSFTRPLPLKRSIQSHFGDIGTSWFYDRTNSEPICSVRELSPLQKEAQNEQLRNAGSHHGLDDEVVCVGGPLSKTNRASYFQSVIQKHRECYQQQSLLKRANTSGAIAS